LRSLAAIAATSKRVRWDAGHESFTCATDGAVVLHDTARVDREPCPAKDSERGGDDGGFIEDRRGVEEHVTESVVSLLPVRSGEPRRREHYGIDAIERHGAVGEITEETAAA
jgi:hypothetical protein